MAGFAYDPEAYKKNLAKMGASIGTPQAAQTPKTTGAIPQSTPAAPKAATPTTTPQGAIPQYTPPAYGSNVAGFDANNAQHVALADAGQAWAQAKAAGDTAGMSAAAARGAEIRSQGAIPNTYDSRTGVTTFQPPQQTVAAPPVTPQPAYTLTPDQIAQEAAYQINKERADLENAVNTQTNTVKNNSEYTNKLLRDMRVLEDQKTARTLNPFSGKTTYDKALISRGREIDDTFRNAELTNQLNAISQDLYNFDKLAPERQRQLINEATRIEREYGLQVGSLTGQIPGMGANGQTLASRQQAWNQNMDVADRTGYLNGQRTLQGIQLDRSMFESDREFEFRKGQQEWERMFAEKQFDESKAERLWEQAFKDKSFAQSVKDEAAARGLQWANLNQRQKEFVADQAFREKQFKLEQDKFDYSKSNSGGAELSDKDSTDNYNTLLDDLESESVTKETARKLLQANKDFLSDSDYNRLSNWINDRFGG